MVVPPSATTVVSTDTGTPLEHLFGRLSRLAGQRDPAHLAPLITVRLQGALTETLKHQGERFFRHMDLLCSRLSYGFSIAAQRPRPDGRTEVTLRLHDGSEATLIIVLENGQPRIDRF